MDGDKLACDSVYFTLFRIVEIGELEGAEAAIQWAEESLEVKDLRQGLVEGVKERMAERELATSARFSRG
jgi:hypothetical protein